jgi:radical SAM-linked protein
VARTPDGPPPPPAVQRLRLRYAKRGRLRFSSHRDFQRSLERALRRAGVPMAYSAGFTPHPKVSYANAAPTGAASEAEYLEIALARRCDPQQLRRALDDALPDGLDLVDAVEAGPGSLADRLQASVWRVELPGVAPAALAAAVEAFLARPRVEVQRMTKSGMRTFDARGAVVSAEVGVPGVPVAVPVRGEGPESAVSPQSSPGTLCAILQVVVRHATPAVRPDDVLAALRAVADLAPPLPPVVTRLAQGPLDEADGTVTDPLAADRAPSAADTPRLT